MFWHCCLAEPAAIVQKRESKSDTPRATTARRANNFHDDPIPF
jgi:hypothetical protein